MGKGTKDWHWREWAVNKCSRDLKTELRDRGRERNIDAGTEIPR